MNPIRTPRADSNRTRATDAFLPLLALILAGWLLAGDARADEPSVYLTWHAPYGQPGATDTLSAGCDSTRADTLWLAFDPGAPSPTFIAMSATLLIHPPLGGVLPASWVSDSLPGGNLRFFKPDCDPKPGLGYPQPWKVNGVGLRDYRHAGSAMKYYLIYATPADEAVSISRKIYVLARIQVQRPDPKDPRCGRPVCIEWNESEFGFAPKDSRTRKATGSHRFVSLNSPGGEVSIPYRKAAALHGWNPVTPP